MILILIFGGLLLLTTGAIIPGELWQLSLSTVGCGLFLGSVLLLVGHDRWHWGLYRTTVRRQTPLVPLTASQGRLHRPTTPRFVHELNVYQLAAAATTSQTATVVNLVRPLTTGTPQVVTTTTVWRCKPGIWHWLFGALDETDRPIQQERTFTLPLGWRPPDLQRG